jgi:hypothetical protein
VESGAVFGGPEKTTDQLSVRPVPSSDNRDWDTHRALDDDAQRRWRNSAAQPVMEFRRDSEGSPLFGAAMFHGTINVEVARVMTSATPALGRPSS